MTEPTTIGGYLRAVRRRRRISIERAAEDTKIRAAFLMRMESDEFDFLAPAYVRGFLKSYARYLQVEPEPLLEEFENRYGGGRIETSQMVALQRREKAVPRERRRLNSWAVAGGAAAVILVILAIVGVATAPDKQEPAGTSLSVATPSPEPEPSLSPSAPAEPTDDPEDVVATKGIELVVDATTGDSWLEVYADGKSVPLYYDTLAHGSSMTFEANDGMFIRLGYPGNVELTVNGRNVGSPGGSDVIELTFPQDLDGLI
ncbi:MAG TPA: RodZ domain-containing protein [Actinomycetota bacterium]|nr:RodZ domain-containing protein [Actinomycetota bacterium]